ETGVHNEKPVHSPCLCTNQLRPAPSRKSRQRRMRRASDEVDAAIGKRQVSPVDRKDQLERHVETFPGKEPKLNCGEGRKIGVRDEIRNGDFHPCLTTLKLGPGPVLLGATFWDLCRRPHREAL